MTTDEARQLRVGDVVEIVTTRRARVIQADGHTIVLAWPRIACSDVIEVGNAVELAPLRVVREARP